MSLYHKNIYWEDWFDKGARKLIKSNLTLSQHLIEHLNNTDDKHKIDVNKLYSIINTLRHTNPLEPFEVEVEDNKVVKCVIRTKYNDDKDICIVFRYGIVVTAYLDDVNDNHATLDYSKYEKEGRNEF